MPDIFYNVIMKKIRILDLVIILLIVSAGIFLIIKTTLHTSLIVSVKADGNEYEYSANAEGIYEISVPAEANDTVKCFVWNGETGMTPVCGVILLK